MTPTVRNGSSGLLLRLPVMAVVALGLLAGLWTGLERLGWDLPPLRGGLAIAHGPLMISGVLGTLIGLERAAALAALPGRAHPWAYLAPLLSGAGGVLLLVGTEPAARALLVGGSVVMVLVSALMLRYQPALYTLVMGLGAVCWLLGNLLWFSGSPVYNVVHLWVAFLLLTIVGERLELSRVRRVTQRGVRLFALGAGLLLAGVLLTPLQLDAGLRLAGLGQIGLALWLLRWDVAVRTVRMEGLPRFIAVCLLAGYVWLGLGGLIGLFSGAVYAGPLYDALLHALLLGFVFSMIFGHAPIIIPALTGRAVAFWPAAAYVYLALLHVSLLLRQSGSLLGDMPARQWGGLLNVAAILLFLSVTLLSVLRGGQQRA